MVEAADHYDMYVARFIDPMTDVLVDSLALAGPGRLLDHGTGTGAVARCVVARTSAVSVVAFDPNRSLLSRLLRDDVERVDARLGTISDVLRSDEWGSFDCVTSQLALSFVDDVHREL